MNNEELTIDPVPGPVDKALEPKVEDAALPRVEFYAIERPSPEGQSYLTFNGGVSWTNDPAKAMRFSRPEDAKAGLAMFMGVPKEAHVALVTVPA